MGTPHSSRMENESTYVPSTSHIDRLHVPQVNSGVGLGTRILHQPHPAGFD